MCQSGRHLERIIETTDECVHQSCGALTCYPYMPCGRASGPRSGYAAWFSQETEKGHISVPLRDAN